MGSVNLGEGEVIQDKYGFEENTDHIKRQIMEE